MHRNYVMETFAYIFSKEHSINNYDLKKHFPIRIGFN